MRSLIVAGMLLGGLPLGREIQAAETTDPLPVANTQNPADRHLSPTEALARITVPDGFQVSLFAGEPDLRQPIAFEFDDRGRLWVVECYSYPEYKAQKTDRILIFSDTDGDGRFDERKIFWDQGTHLTGIQLGFGGVWVCSSPELLFIPDADGDDRPDGPPRVLLDGWNLRQVQHNIVNGLTWGPDGWLYGRHGIQAESRVGKPGTPDDERVKLNCGIWRYHPTRHEFEVVAHGTTNPWGLDFNDYGEAFFTNNVNGHLWHLVPGAHYQRMHGSDYNPHAYELMTQTADHLHWAGDNWTASREGKGAHGELGGGHSHSGGMIYLGDNWPDKYRDTILMSNTHGNRLNHDLLERHGSGYVGRHGQDFFRANDPWFRGVELKYGPDGGVFVIDWNDFGECHDNDGTQRSTGRMYKIVHGKPRPSPADLNLKTLDALQLVELQLHKNDWFVRHARRLLQERAAAGDDLTAAKARLNELLAEYPDVTRRLRALWALECVGGVSENQLIGLLTEPNEHLRVWAVRLLSARPAPSSAVVAQLTALARKDESGLVRLHLASALQRLDDPARAAIARELAALDPAKVDENLTRMIWYGVEPLVAGDPAQAATLATTTKQPKLRRFIARRLTLESDPVARQPVVKLLGELKDPVAQRDLLQGMYDALRGRRSEPLPEGWSVLHDRLADSPDWHVRSTHLALSVIFGDRQALARQEATLLDTSADLGRRQAALQVLVEHRAAGLAPQLQALLAEPPLRGAALRGLAAYDEPGIAEAILARYDQFSPENKRDALQTLAARPEWAHQLLAAVEAKQVPASDLTAYDARQIQTLGRPELTAQLEKLWGLVRESSGEKQKLIADYSNLLKPDYLKHANLPQGRRLFNETCASCHRLFGEGGQIGPDITGSNRDSLYYLLENIIDPNATVARGYQMTTVLTGDGRVVSGLVVESNDRTLTLQTATERLVLDRGEVDSLMPSQVSMMPEGLLTKLSDEEIRDLIGYLGAKAQSPLPTEKPAADDK